MTDTINQESAPYHCMCESCKDGDIHSSDCAVHNMPAYPNGLCDCQLSDEGRRKKYAQESADYMAMLNKQLPVIGLFSRLGED